MKVMTPGQAPAVPAALDGRILFSAGRTEVIHLQLQPGETLATHTNPVDVVFYVLEGRAGLTAGDESFLMERDHYISVLSSVPRSWCNKGEGLFRVLVIKMLP